MMRVGNQAWFHGLMPIINDLHALVETLQAKFQKREEDKRKASISSWRCFSKPELRG